MSADLIPAPQPIDCNKLCDIADWERPHFRRAAAELMCCDSESVPRHRKVWEFTQAILALQAAGVWHEEALGLSVAGGQERFLFFAANHIGRMVSTDIYGLGDFAKREADRAFIEHPEKSAPFPFRADRLQVGTMNALQLLFADNLFDFAVSFSSIEHFGGMKAASRAVAEMVRTVRPGGLVAVTTDCSLNGFTTNEVFTKGQIETLCAESGCELLAPFTWEISADSKRHLCDMLRGDVTRLPHVNLKVYAAIFTSVCFVLRKKESRSQPALPVAQRVAAVQEALTRSRALADRDVLPPPTAAERARAYIARKVRGARYRLEERFCAFALDDC